MPISFHATPEERELISKIVDRAHKDIYSKHKDIRQTRRDTALDLEACNANGNPLDFAKLLEFPPFDFSHDILGIRKNINRETGEMQNFFHPRCSK